MDSSIRDTADWTAKQLRERLKAAQAAGDEQDSIEYAERLQRHPDRFQSLPHGPASTSGAGISQLLAPFAARGRAAEAVMSNRGSAAVSWSWRENPLSIALRRILREYPLGTTDSPVLEAQAAFRWAEEQDAEIERIAAGITLEVREQIALEAAARELAEALGRAVNVLSLIQLESFFGGKGGSLKHRVDKAILSGREALAKAGKKP